MAAATRVRPAWPRRRSAGDPGAGLDLPPTGRR
jgi:hypothetical protein